MFIRVCREFSLPLIAGVVTALFWANLGNESYMRFIHEPFAGEHINFHFLVNDIFMVFFFGIAGVELVNSLSPGGALNPVRKAVTPLMATAGGVLAPICVFFLLNGMLGSPQYLSGWGITTATDIALAWLLARMVFGKEHPAVSFLLLLAVADDGVGLVIVAIFYGDPYHPVKASWLILVLVAMAAAALLRKKQIQSYWPYLLLCGGISWTGMFQSHLHPALSLIFIIPFLPRTGRIVSNPDAHGLENAVGDSALHKFEHQITPFVDFGLFFFGLANAGVAFSNISNLTWIIFISIVGGKTLGISLFTWLGTRLRCSLPEGMGVREVVMTGLIGGMGLTVALFVASVAYSDLSIQAASKMGALFTALVFAPALILARIFGIGRFSRKSGTEK